MRGGVRGANGKDRDEDECVDVDVDVEVDIDTEGWREIRRTRASARITVSLTEMTSRSQRTISRTPRKAAITMRSAMRPIWRVCERGGREWRRRWRERKGRERSFMCREAETNMETKRAY